MAVLITSDNDRELYFVKEMLDTGLHNVSKKRKEALKMNNIPLSVQITYNKIPKEVVEKLQKMKEDREQSTL